MNGFRTSKCFEGSGPVLIWAATARLAGGGWWKGYLIADAQQKSFGVRLAATKGDDLKINGGIVTMMRKHARTAAIAAVFADPVSGHIWLPLFTGGGYSETPHFWLQLAHGLPPELRFIDATGTALIRKSSQGTYTKRWALTDPLPTYPPHATLVDLSSNLLASINTGQVLDGRTAPAAMTAAAAPTSTSPLGDAAAGDRATLNPLPPPQAATAEVVPAPLPDYQRSARDRLNRRSKTLAKSAQRLAQEQVKAASGDLLAIQAAQLAAYLHRVRPDMSELRLLPADTDLLDELVIPLAIGKSPGQNLSDLYLQIKKARRSASSLAKQIATLQDDIIALSDDLVLLRSSVLPLAVVEQLLRRYHLNKDSQAHTTEPAKTPFRTIYWQPPGNQDATQRIRLLVGKSAADSDELCRQAKGHDLWLHVVGTTGSHVIIPFRQLKQGSNQQLIRAAAILALHYSKLRGDQRGEVYVSRRQFIKKRKGMPPGLWQIDQAETLFCRYDSAELAQVLSQTEGP